MLKSSGVSIKDHPVIDQLIKCRTMIEKIQPLDKKLKYQIDKLLKSANTGTLVGSSKDDPLQHRPNLSSMGGDDDEDEDDDGEQGLDNDYDDENSRIAQRAGVYQAPKLYGAKGGVIDQEDAIAKKKSKEIRDKQKSIKGKMAKEIEEIYGDKPEEEDDYLDGSGGGSSSRYHGDDEEDDERALKNYEESNYTRVMLSKKEQKAMKSKQKKLSDGLNDLADFSDLTSLMENEDDKEAKENQDYLRKKRMASILNNELGRNKRARSADEDIPLPEKQNKRDFNRSRDDEVESGGESDDDIDSFNNNNKSQEPQYDGIPRTNNFDTSKDFSHKEGDKRKVSKSIEKNRGLTRQRSRENRTPHLRQRNRFEKATKKRSNVIQTAERKDTSYTGTKSINTNSRRAQPYAH